MAQSSVNTLAFKFATDILRRLGEELNPSPEHGILELVKNSFDADAINCEIVLEKVGSGGGTVTIADDGDGMEIDAIRDGWLVIGKSAKERSVTTRLGRRVAGDKGLGRLAGLRLGKQVRLVSRPRSSPERQFVIDIDWTAFDDQAIVEDVAVPVVEQRNETGRFGTDIKLLNLKRPLSRWDVKRLARSLILLADPFGDDPASFKPKLHATEFKDLSKLVANRYFSEARYHLQASVDENGIGRAKVLDWTGQQIWSAEHDELARESKATQYQSPGLTFDMWMFLLSSSEFNTRQASKGDVRSWLQEVGGVHVYYNGLRVKPYGDKGDDWLGLNLMRARSPEERPSTNNTVGRVVISDESQRLVQKTDRSGFIEDEAFQEIRRFSVDCLNWVARKRLAERENRRAAARSAAPKRTERAESSVESAIDQVSGSPKEEILHAFRSYKRKVDREVTGLRKEIQLYRTLSTAGITSAVFAHESANNPIKIIQQSVKTVRRRAIEHSRAHYESKLGEPIDRIIRAVESLKVLSGVTLSLIDHEKRRTGKISVHEVIQETARLYEPFLSTHAAQLKLRLAPTSPWVLSTRAALESVITNLLNNSLAMFDQKKCRKRHIEIHTFVEDGMLELRFSDSGPGIEDISVDDIWLPGETTTQNGTGLGLTIVRDAVTDMRGVVSAVAHGSMGGAEIAIRLPLGGIE